MPKTKLKDVAQQLDKATRELSKEQHDWKIERGKIRRQNVQLSAVNKDLERKNKASQVQLEQLQAEIAATELHKKQLDDKNDELVRLDTDLENSIRVNTDRVKEITAELETKKASLDKDLDEYSVVRKQEIKTSILKVNEALSTVNAELALRNSELESKKTELGELNQVYLDEQAAIKLSSAETEEKLTANRELVAETEEKVDTLKQQLKELEYTKDGVMVRLAKAKEEHEKFLDYERRARKALDTKDRELQNRIADIATESQFLKNQRSLLPEL